MDNTNARYQVYQHAQESHGAGRVVESTGSSQSDYNRYPGSGAPQQQSTYPGSGPGPGQSASYTGGRFAQYRDTGVRMLNSSTTPSASASPQLAPITHVQYSSGSAAHAHNRQVVPNLQANQEYVERHFVSSTKDFKGGALPPSPKQAPLQYMSNEYHAQSDYVQIQAYTNNNASAQAYTHNGTSSSSSERGGSSWGPPTSSAPAPSDGASWSQYTNGRPLERGPADRSQPVERPVQPPSLLTRHMIPVTVTPLNKPEPGVSGPVLSEAAAPLTPRSRMQHDPSSYDRVDRDDHRSSSDFGKDQVRGGFSGPELDRVTAAKVNAEVGSRMMIKERERSRQQVSRVSDTRTHTAKMNASSIPRSFHRHMIPINGGVQEWCLVPGSNDCACACANV